MSKKLNTRIQYKYDTEENWASCDQPSLKGELYVHECNDGNMKLSIGDGYKNINNLPTLAFDSDKPPVTEITLDRIEVTQGPDKIVYVLNSDLQLDTEGLVVNAYYSDGSHKDVTDNIGIDEPDLTEKGSKSITVSYENQTASFDVGVYQEVDYPSAKDIIYDGETSIPPGWGIYVHPGTESIVLIGVDFGTDVGIYSAEFKVKSENYYCWNNGYLGTATIPYRVKPAVNTIELKDTNGNAVNSVTLTPGEDGYIFLYIYGKELNTTNIRVTPYTIPDTNYRIVETDDPEKLQLYISLRPDASKYTGTITIHCEGRKNYSDSTTSFKYNIAEPQDVIYTWDVYETIVSNSSSSISYNGSYYYHYDLYTASAMPQVAYYTYSVTEIEEFYCPNGGCDECNWGKETHKQTVTHNSDYCCCGQGDLISCSHTPVYIDVDTPGEFIKSIITTDHYDTDKNQDYGGTYYYIKYNNTSAPYAKFTPDYSKKLDPVSSYSCLAHPKNSIELINDTTAYWYILREE